jgi:putative ABC transport system permease protein
MDARTAPAPKSDRGRGRGRGADLRLLIAWRNLAHDRIRFLVTLVGIVFSVVLMAVQSGLLVGFVVTIANVVDNTAADIWVVGRGVRSVDLPTAIPERRRYQILSLPGIATVDPLMHVFAILKRPDGGAESVVVVGFDTATGIGGPWDLIEGRAEDLQQPDAVILDRLYRDKLGIERVGQVVEINGRRARVVGFTDGIRTFTQAPHVFADIKTARHLAGFAEDQLNYLLVRAVPGQDHAALRDAIRARVPEIDAHSRAEFARRSVLYWLVTTGAGFSLVISAALGLVVGIVVTAQTLYATTIDHLPEYATMRAMGAPARYLYGIILRQAAIAAGLGYAIGIAIAGLVVASARDSSAAMLMPWPLAAGLGAATVAMCAAAALISIRKVMAIDPVSVFR